MPKNKIKLLVAFGFIALIAVVLGFSPNFTANADGDEIVKEIASYKTWTKINEKPIKVTNITLDNVGGG